MDDVRGRQAIEAAAVQMFQSMTVEGFTIESFELTVQGDSVRRNMFNFISGGH